MKKIIIGLVIGLMLGMSTNAFAAIGDKVQAVFAEFNYVVNGESKTLDAPVLVYEGTSYVRTTQISNLLGYDVTYKADSRTIEFNKPELVPVQTLSPTQKTVHDESTLTLEPTPTPLPDGVVPMESAALNATPDPNATPVPSIEPTPTVTPSPTPAPSNVAACQAIRDNYNGQIGLLAYQGLKQGPYLLAVHLKEYERDQALSAAGCN